MNGHDVTDDTHLVNALARHAPVFVRSGTGNALRADVCIPGAITGLFCIIRTQGGAIAGTTGIGICIDAGVTVCMNARPSPSGVLDVTSNGAPAQIPVLSHLARGACSDICREHDISLSISTTLPIGAGFGVSGATALGAALCLAQLAPLGGNPVQWAYDADVATGGGYGDIVTQVHGGISLRREPGLHGTVAHIPPRGRVAVSGTFGPLSTKDILSDDAAAARITDAGNAYMGSVSAASGIREIMSLCNAFSHRCGLMTPRLSDAIDAVTAAHDVPASMVMLGESLFTLARPAQVQAIADVMASFDIQPIVSPLRGGF